jgi:hypothetical protein
VGSLFSWKSLLTKRMTSEDCEWSAVRIVLTGVI